MGDIKPASRAEVDRIESNDGDHDERSFGCPASTVRALIARIRLLERYLEHVRSLPSPHSDDCISLNGDIDQLGTECDCVFGDLERQLREVDGE